MYKQAIDKNCDKCGRVLYRNFVELDGEEWEIREYYKTVETFRPRCWPCSCNSEDHLTYGGEPAKARHIDIINFAAEKSGGCGCGG